MNKNKLIKIGRRSFFIPFLTVSLFAELPSFSFQSELTANGEVIRANSMCASPAPVDWDGDGDLDLLMGEFGPNTWPPQAGIRLYLNSAGPGEFPVLSGGDLLKAGGSPIALTAG